LSFKIKGEFLNNERIYLIQKSYFLKNLFENIKNFKTFIKKLLESINDLNSRGIIHCDIKPENILINFPQTQNLNNYNIKIIDFGSAINLNEINSSDEIIFTSNTPEYLCPEILNCNKNFLVSLFKNKKKFANCIDVYSVGTIIIELLLCCPIWLNYKAKVIKNKKAKFNFGFFGFNRDCNKIYKKKIELEKNIKNIIKNSFVNEKNRENLEKFLKGILEKDFKKRLNVNEALQSEFFYE